MNVDFTSKPLTVDDILERLDFLNQTTKTLAIRGDCTKESVKKVSTTSSLKQIIKKIFEQCAFLHHLRLEYVNFDWVADVIMNTFH